MDYYSEQVQNFTIADPKQMPLGIQKAMSELNGDGGGWISGGPTTGYYNDAGSFTEWPFYCASRAAWRCQKQVKIRCAVPHTSPLPSPHTLRCRSRYAPTLYTGHTLTALKHPKGCAMEYVTATTT